MKQIILVNGAEKCQAVDHYGNRAVVIKNSGHESHTNVVEYKVVRDVSRSVKVIMKETSDVDLDEAEVAPAPSRRRNERGMKKPDILAFSAKTYETNGSGDDTLAADDELDALASDCKAALVMAVLRGDALVNTARQVSMKSPFDYPEPVDHIEAMASADAEE